MSIHDEIKELQEKVDAMEEEKRLKEIKRVLECRLNGYCPWCHTKHDPSNTLCDGQGYY